MKEPTLDEMWKRIERFGIKREMFEKSNPNEETIRQLYEMIREKRRQRRETDTILLLQEYIKNMKNRERFQPEPRFEIDAHRAEEIARELLRQHQSVLVLQSKLEDDVWLVKAKTTTFGEIIVKQVRIDAKTGRIINVE